MRKACLLLLSGLALIAWTGLGTQAAWADDPEPDCAGYSADVQGFHFGTVPTTGNATSLVYGGAALCGTDWSGVLFKDLYGAYKEGYILTPGGMDAGEKGVTVRCANPANAGNGHEAYCDNSGGDLPADAYTGSSGVDVVGCSGGASGNKIGTLCIFYGPDSLKASVYVNKSPGNPANNKCASSKIVGCYQSTDWLSLGYGNITVEPCWLNSACSQYDPQHVRYLMHIYPMTAVLTNNMWYTEIGEPSYNHSSEPNDRDYIQCEYANVADPGSKECGTDPTYWIQKNGPAGQYKCTVSKPEGAAVRTIGKGTLLGVPKDKCVAVTWT